MKNLPVHWYEGLFLRPHHLQAAERHWSELLSTSLCSDNPYNYGLFRFEYSKEALANYQLDITSLKARMRDGTLIELGTESTSDRVDLKGAINDVSQLVASLGDAVEQTANVRVYLAVPHLRMGRNNCRRTQEDDPGARYTEARISVADENRGGHDQEVQFRDLNVKLLLSTQDLAGHELLPIAQFQRVVKGTLRLGWMKAISPRWLSPKLGLPCIDATFKPPWISSVRTSRR